MTSSYLSLFLLVILILSPCRSFANIYNELNVVLNNSLKHFVRENNIPGAVLSIKLPHQKIITFAAGVADVKDIQPMRANTLFPIGSITKSFTSAAILKLVEKGQLSLQDTLGEIASAHPSVLSYLIKQHPELKYISVRELLNHTSGLPSALNSILYEKAFQKNPLKYWTNLELIQLALKQKILFHPGALGLFHYTNTDYILVNMIYNSISIDSLGHVIYKLLNDANINNAFYPISITESVPKFIKQHLSQGYMPENPYWPLYLMKVFRTYPKVYIINNKIHSLAYNVTAIDLSQTFVAPAAGGIIMSVSDMVKWYENLFIKKNILNKLALEKMLISVPTNDGYSYGLGITKRYLKKFHIEVYSHTGSNFGFNTNVVYVKGHGIVIAAAINTQKDLLRVKKGLIASILAILSRHGYLNKQRICI